MAKAKLQANITADQLIQALKEMRMVAIMKVGKGETDYIELFMIDKDSNYLHRVIGDGYSQARECFAVGGGNYDKCWHVVEMIAAQLDVYREVFDLQSGLQKIYV